MHLKECKKCNKVYKTVLKNSRICDSCKSSNLFYRSRSSFSAKDKLSPISKERK